MRDILLGCELQATTSQRAAQAFEDLRQDVAWLDAGTTAVVRQDDKLRWWTFGGLHANAALAAHLKSAHQIPAVANNLSIRLGDHAPTDRVETALRGLRSVPAEDLVPDVSVKATEGLKFNACLPMDLATRVLQMRTADYPAVRRVVAEPVRFITMASDERSDA
jgi:ATP-dependent helicase Lhr and Lhr-like helicase